MEDEMAIKFPSSIGRAVAGALEVGAEGIEDPETYKQVMALVAGLNDALSAYGL
jgi:hypothetical protein